MRNPRRAFKIEPISIQRHHKSERDIGSQLIYAKSKIKKLDEMSGGGQSQLVKYRRNFTVPAVWIPEQGLRISNIPMIPPEKIENLDTYITANVNRIDGGDIGAV